MMVVKVLGVSAELSLDHRVAKGSLRLIVEVEKEDGSTVRLEDGLDVGLTYNEDTEPSFQHMSSITRSLGRNLIEHPFLKLTLCESPIELSFFFNAMYKIPQLRPQVEVGPHRVDLAMPEKKVAIELDGHQFHKPRTQRANDAKRQRFLQKEGWLVIRFTGTEINRDVDGCIEDAIKIVQSLPQVGE